MNSVFAALSSAFSDLFRFRVLWIMVWPILAAVLLWLLLGITFSTLFSDWIGSALVKIGIQSWLDNLGSGWVAHTIQVIVYLLLFLPLVFITALVMTALFAMPALIRLVSERDYPQLCRQPDECSAWNAYFYRHVADHLSPMVCRGRRDSSIYCLCISESEAVPL